MSALICNLCQLFRGYHYELLRNWFTLQNMEILIRAYIRGNDSMFNIRLSIAILLATGCSINMNAMQEKSMNIFEASKTGDVPRIREIIKEDPAIINIRDEIQQTPLHIAAENGHLDIVKIFISADADINAEDENKNTPLHLAAAAGNIAAVLELINAGAAIWMQNKESCDPLDLAIENDHKEVVQALLDAHAIDNTQHLRFPRIEVHYFRTLFLAIYHGRKEIFQLLLAKIANINILDDVVDEDDYQYNEHVKLIHFAILFGCEEIVQILLDSHANIEAQDIRKATPLHYAAHEGNTAIAEMLIKAGANVNAVDRNNRTPLYLAVENNHKTVVQALINAHANMNIQDKEGLSPLHQAIACNRLDLVRMLGQAGADLTLADKKGRTPTAHARAVAKALEHMHADKTKAEELITYLNQIAPATAQLKATTQTAHPDEQNLREPEKPLFDLNDDEVSQSSDEENPTEHNSVEEAMHMDNAVLCPPIRLINNNATQKQRTHDDPPEVMQQDSFKYTKLKKNLNGHTTAVFSPDGNELIVAPDLELCRFDTCTGNSLPSLNHVMMANWPKYSPDSNKIITADWEGCSAYVWDRSTGKLLFTLTGHQKHITSIDFSHDGKQIVTASRDHTARTWNADTGECIKTFLGHKWTVDSAIFSPDDKTILTLSTGDLTTRLWNTSTGNCLTTLLLNNEQDPEEDAPISALFSPNGKRFLINSSNWIAIYTNNGDYILRLLAPNRTIDWRPDSKTIVTAFPEEFTASIWDARKGNRVRTLKGHKEYVPTAFYSPDGEKVITASCDQTARIWDAKNGRCIHILKCPEFVDLKKIDNKDYLDTHEFHFASFSPDGRTIATVCHDLIIWRDLRPANRIFALALAQHLRLGQNSPARLLSKDTLQHIAHYASADSFGY